MDDTLILEAKKRGVSRQRIWQIKRRAEGRCPICGSSELATQVFCNEHAKGKKRRTHWKAKGLCVDCGSSQLETKLRCYTHAKKESERQKKLMGYTTPKRITKYQPKEDTPNA